SASFECVGSPGDGLFGARSPGPLMRLPTLRAHGRPWTRKAWLPGGGLFPGQDLLDLMMSSRRTHLLSPAGLAGAPERVPNRPEQRRGQGRSFFRVPAKKVARPRAILDAAEHRAKIEDPRSKTSVVRAPLFVFAVRKVHAKTGGFETRPYTRSAQRPTHARCA